MVFMILLLLLTLVLTNIYGRDNIYVQLVIIIIIITYVVLAGIYGWELPLASKWYN